MKTTTTISLVLIVSIAGACDTYSRDDILFRRAIPAKSDIALQPPGTDVETANTSAEAVSELRQGLSVCLEDNLRCTTQGIATGLNVLTFFLLSVIDTMHILPPTRREAHRRVWGPHFIERDNNTFRFEMTKNLDDDGVFDGTFTHCLHVTPGKVDWQLSDPIDCSVDVDVETGLTRILYGTMIPGLDDDDDDVNEDAARSGAGTLIFDANKMADLTGDRGLLGVLTFVYDNTSNPKTISIAIADVLDDDENVLPENANYSFVGYDDGAGEFAYQVNSDIQNPTQQNGPSALESLIIRAKWQGDGAGRAEADILGGDLGPLVWDVTECWGPSLEITWRRHADPEIADVGVDESLDCQIPAFQ